MANITKRTNKSGQESYLIRVFVDQKSDGTQTTKSKTWKPALGMSNKQIERELNRQATLFEESVKTGLVAMDGRTRFEDYAARWMEATPLAPKTHSRYKSLLKRINEAIGHIRLDKLQGFHLEEFYKNLSEQGMSEKGKYAFADDLEAIIEKKGLTKAKVAKKAGVAPSTVSSACAGNRVAIEKAEQISKALKISMEKTFNVQESTSGLSDKTILHHHRLISAILAKAKKERLVPFNVASEHATPPKVQRKEAVHLDDEQAQLVIELLFDERDIRVKTSLILLFYSGVRRGELCGLSWPDIDFTNQMIHIKRASQYQQGKGIQEVPTKNTASERSIKLPGIVFEVLSQYRKWWLEEKLKNGSYWKGEQERLFIQADGKPINPDTINYWMNKFIEKNKLPHFSPHACRHTFATLQIASGVDIRTLQARTGHAQASTLVNTYSHALKSASEAAADVVDDKLTPKKFKQA